MDNALLTQINSSKHVLVVLPTKPYFDQVAAALSLYLSLSEKSDIEVYSPVPMNVAFNRLVGVNKIKSEVGNKNLIITFPNYKAENIEKVSYDIDNGEFKLTVAPKTGLVAPQDGQVNLSYSGMSADLVILVGGANTSHFPILSSKELEGIKVAHIGVRNLEVSGENNIMSFASPSSSVSELVANFIKDNNMEIYPDIATNLLAGIEEGTNHFEGSDVTPLTFETFAYLLRSGGQRQPKPVAPGAFPPGAIPGKQIAIEQQILEKIENKEVPEVVNPPSNWLDDPKIYKGTSVS